MPASSVALKILIYIDTEAARCAQPLPPGNRRDSPQYRWLYNRAIQYSYLGEECKSALLRGCDVQTVVRRCDRSDSPDSSDRSDSDAPLRQRCAAQTATRCSDGDAALGPGGTFRQLTQQGQQRLPAARPESLGQGLLEGGMQCVRPAQQRSTAAREM